jgi:hypothetical protein
MGRPMKWQKLTTHLTDIKGNKEEKNKRKKEGKKGGKKEGQYVEELGSPIEEQ